MPTTRNVPARHFAIQALLLFVAASDAPAIMSAPSPGDEPPITIYDARARGTSADALRRLGEERRTRVALEAGGLGAPDAFNAKARLAFKTESRETVAHASPLSVISPSVPAGTQWRVDAHVYSWTGGTTARRSLAIPLEPEPAALAVTLRKFEELWIDHSSSPGIAACEIGVELQLRRQAARAKVIVARAAHVPALERLSTIDPFNARWREKEVWYVAGRLLGLAYDKQWRFAQDREFAVLQRRMYEPLDGVEAMELAMFPRVAVEQVNLRVVASDGTAALIEFAHIEKTRAKDSDDIRLSVPRALQRHFPRQWMENMASPGKHKFHATELALFTPGQAAAIAQAGSVRAVHFLGSRPAAANGEVANRDIVSLEHRIVPRSSHRDRLSVDLRPLLGGGDLTLEKAVVHLIGPATERSCETIIERVQLVSPYMASAPTYATVLEKRMRGWGGPYLLATPERDMIEAPVIVAHLPFAALAPGHTSARGTSLDRPSGPQAASSRSRKPLGMLQLPYRVADEFGSTVSPRAHLLASSGGAKLQATGPFPAALEAGDSLLLHGKSESIDIEWPLDASIDRGSMMYFDVPIGADHIARSELQLIAANERSWSVRVSPNQALVLPFTAGRVKRAKLRIFPAVSPFRIEIKELAFFVPSPMSFGEALSAALPVKARQQPMAIPSDSQAQGIEAGRGYVRGRLQNLEIEFSTSLAPAMAAPHGIYLQYSLASWRFEDDPCQLQIAMNWQRRRIVRQICFPDGEGKVHIPFASLLGDLPDGTVLGPLEGITWRIRPATRSSTKPSFSLTYEIEGWDMSSMTDRLRSTPYMAIGTQPVLADAITVDAIARRPYMEKLWLPISSDDLAKIFNTRLRVEPVDQVYFAVDQVVLEPKTALTAEQWRELRSGAQVARPPRWPAWLGVAVVILIPWLAWLKDMWSPGRMLGWVSRLARAAVSAGRVASLGVAHLLRRVNVGGGLALSAATLWVAGRWAGTFSGTMALVAAALFATSVYRYWNDAASRRSSWWAVAIGAACGIWALGRFGLAREAVWALLPMAAALYTSLPELLRAGGGLARERPLHMRAAGWVFATAALYAAGLSKGAPAGTNYLFTFGALAAVFASRSLLLLAVGRLRLHLPAATKTVYGDAAASYFATALIALSMVALSLAAGRESIAEQFAVIVYFSLVIGVAKLFLNRLRGGHDGAAAGRGE